MTVHMIFTDIEEYNVRSIAILGCNIYSHITVAHVTLPKAVLSTVKIFAVYLILTGKAIIEEVFYDIHYHCHSK